MNVLVQILPLPSGIRANVPQFGWSFVYANEAEAVASITRRIANSYKIEPDTVQLLIRKA